MIHLLRMMLKVPSRRVLARGPTFIIIELQLSYKYFNHFFEEQQLGSRITNCGGKQPRRSISRLPAPRRPYLLSPPSDPQSPKRANDPKNRALGLIHRQEFRMKGTMQQR